MEFSVTIWLLVGILAALIVLFLLAMVAAKYIVSTASAQWEIDILSRRLQGFDREREDFL